MTRANGSATTRRRPGSRDVSEPDGPHTTTPDGTAGGEGRRVRIDSGRSSLLVELHEFWSHRELLYYLTWRDIKVRYAQTAFGAAWALLQPLLTMLIFTVVFGHLARIPSEGIPYPIFAYAGLLPWTFFANGITLSSMSLVMTPELITKVYFPRLTMPIASILGGLLDLAIGALALIGLCAYYGIAPGMHALVLLPLLLLAFVTAMGVGFLLSALNVQYRDVRYVVPFLVQIWLFTTPIAYPSSLFGQPWRTIVGLNPMVGVIEGFRWALLGTRSAPGLMMLASIGTAILLLVVGLLYFRRVEDKFADVI